MESAGGPVRGELIGSVRTDVAIVGAGIVGLTTALLLAESGRNVVVVEADRVAAGVSGYTTAKLTAGHGFIYSHLEKVGAGVARAYAESQVAALDYVIALCGRSAIECDLESRTNYVVVESEDDMDALEAELSAAARAGLNVRPIADTSVVPIPVVGGLMLEGQAQFHVRKYLLALAQLAVDAGARIYDRSPVTEISGSGPYGVETATGDVTAAAVVVATHYPIVEQRFFATRIHPRRSYVVALPLTGLEPDGMFINVGSPTRSLRTAPLPDGGRLLLVGGEGHRVGQDANTSDRYAALEQFASEHFAVGAPMYRWSTQDNHSVDRLPYVGRVGEGGELYVATGFAGWGMTNGTAAALLLTDAIKGSIRSWAKIYRLDRRHLAASVKSFLIENTNVAALQLRRVLPSHSSDTVPAVETIPNGHGVIVTTDGTATAVSRDMAGTLHAVSPSCTHMGCSITWNTAESTWDCPCHGSRFAPDGHVLHGPALKPLEALPVPSGSEDPST